MMEVYLRMIRELEAIEADLRSRWNALAVRMSALSDEYRAAHEEWAAVTRALESLRGAAYPDRQEVPL